MSIKDAVGFGLGGLFADRLLGLGGLGTLVGVGAALFSMRSSDLQAVERFLGETTQAFTQPAGTAAGPRSDGGVGGDFSWKKGLIYAGLGLVGLNLLGSLCSSGFYGYGGLGGYGSNPYLRYW